MKQQEKNHLAKFLILLTLFLIIFLFGIFLNQLVVRTNDGRMPVFFYHSNYESETHFFYNNKGEVNLWYLSDIYYVENKYLMFGLYNKGAIFSIGDVFIDLGFLGSVFCFAGLLSYGIGFCFDKLKARRG